MKAGNSGMKQKTLQMMKIESLEIIDLLSVSYPIEENTSNKSKEDVTIDEANSILQSKKIDCRNLTKQLV